MKEAAQCEAPLENPTENSTFVMEENLSHYLFKRTVVGILFAQIKTTLEMILSFYFRY